MKADRALHLRAQEIIANTDGPISALDAFEQAFRERYPNASRDELFRVMAGMAAASASDMRKRTYVLPEPGQGSLMPELPSMIVIKTPDGDMFIPSSLAKFGQGRQWMKEGRRFHAVQHLRFFRAHEDCETYGKDIDPEMPWEEAARIIDSAKRLALETNATAAVSAAAAALDAAFAKAMDEAEAAEGEEPEDGDE